MSPRRRPIVIIAMHKSGSSNPPQTHGDAASAIRLFGVHTHNLKGIDVDVPLGKRTVLTGVSGSGKSSLAFDTLHAEGHRRYIETFSPYSRQFLPMLERPTVDRIENVPPSIAVAQNSRAAKSSASVAAATGLADYLRLAFARAATIVCPTCQLPVKAWTTSQIVAELRQSSANELVTVAFPIVRDRERDVSVQAIRLREQGFLRLHVGDRIVRMDEPIPPIGIGEQLRVIVDRLRIGMPETPRAHEAIETALRHGGGFVDVDVAGQWRRFCERAICPSCGESFPTPEPALFFSSHPEASCRACSGIGREASGAICSDCGGKRFRPHVLAYRWCDADFDDWSRFSVEHARRRLHEAPSARSDSHSSIRHLFHHIARRLECLSELGLGYVTLDRSVRSLSSGEARRVALTGALATGLARTLFVLDEPTAGLHPADTSRLLDALHRLCEDENTVVVVEHDSQVIQDADHVIELGPGAGDEGGRIVFEGKPRDLLACESSATAQYLRSRVAPQGTVRASRGSLRVRGARTNNLKNVDVCFPLGGLTVLAGVSGAGKSSLVADTLYPGLIAALAKKNARLTGCDAIEGFEPLQGVVLVDDDSVARTPRGNPATYVKFFDEVRALFAETPDAKVAGLSAGDFSFNRPGGRCETCEGLGRLAVDMQFLPDVQTVCPDCAGKRFQPKVLDVKFRGRNIVEVLDLNVRDAFSFFRGVRSVQIRIAALKEVGLDYLAIGQPLSTLSGGEAQRLKLATYVAGHVRHRTLFLFDEPTSGLHPVDVDRWLSSVDLLLDHGHTVIVIEHNLQVIARADVVIELGPGAGDEGGRVVAVATPSELANLDTATGRAIRRAMHVDRGQQ